jgi:hypothetical protein
VHLVGGLEGESRKTHLNPGIRNNKAFNDRQKLGSPQFQPLLGVTELVERIVKDDI